MIDISQMTPVLFKERDLSKSLPENIYNYFEKYLKFLPSKGDRVCIGYSFYKVLSITHFIDEARIEILILKD